MGINFRIVQSYKVILWNHLKLYVQDCNSMKNINNILIGWKIQFQCLLAKTNSYSNGWYISCSFWRTVSQREDASSTSFPSRLVFKFSSDGKGVSSPRGPILWSLGLVCFLNFYGNREKLIVKNGSQRCLKIKFVLN